MTENIIKNIRGDESGLIPAVARRYDTGVFLMVAWVNPRALLVAIEEGQAVYFSRSRKKLWRKGEESGHAQKLRSIRLDCDYDTNITGSRSGWGHCLSYRLTSLFLLQIR